MTKTIDGEVALKPVQPLVHRHAHEIQSYETVARTALSGPEDARSEARVSLIIPARARDFEGMDSVAGCEFVDDRIRLE